VALDEIEEPDTGGVERELAAGGRRAHPGVPAQDVDVVRRLPRLFALEDPSVLDALAGDVEPLQGERADARAVGDGQAHDAHRQQQQTAGGDQRLGAGHAEEVVHGQREKDPRRAEWTKNPSARPSPAAGSYCRGTNGRSAMKRTATVGPGTAPMSSITACRPFAARTSRL